jgi:hypothetical protein
MVFLGCSGISAALIAAGLSNSVTFSQTLFLFRAWGLFWGVQLGSPSISVDISPGYIDDAYALTAGEWQ